VIWLITWRAPATTAMLSRLSGVARRVGEVQWFTQPGDQFELGFQVVDVVFLVHQQLLEQLRGDDVALLAAHRDPGTQPVHDLDLDGEIGLELFGDRLADAQREQALEIGQSFEEQDAVGEQLGVLHLLDRLRAGVLGELRQPPVGLHLRVQEVLVDRGELAGELLVEQCDHFIVATHGDTSDD